VNQDLLSVYLLLYQVTYTTTGVLTIAQAVEIADGGGFTMLLHFSIPIIPDTETVNELPRNGASASESSPESIA
jgi:hypothetical protein